MSRLVISTLTAFGTTAILLWLLRPVAIRLDLLDSPSERKSHFGRVPLIGGLAMFCGFALAALTLAQGLTQFRSFFAAAAILVVVGVLDDLHELSSRARFIAQIIAAGLMAYWGGILLEDVGAIGLGGSVISLGVWTIPFTIFCTVGVINALNMCDGLDGLAGGLSLVPLAGMGYVAYQAELNVQGTVLLLLGAALVAFLIFNLRLPGRSQALVFMGDAGSMFLGFAITWFVIDLSQGDDRAMTPVTALWLLMVPLFDTVWLLVKRPLTGRWPTQADYEHLHHILQMVGMSVNQSVGLMWFLAFLMACVGLVAAGYGVSEQLMFVSFLGVFAVYCVVMTFAWHRRTLLWWPVDRRVTGEERRTAPSPHAEGERRGEDRRAGVSRDAS